MKYSRRSLVVALTLAVGLAAPACGNAESIGLTSTDAPSGTASSTTEAQPSTSRPDQESLGVVDRVMAFDGFLTELPASDMWAGHNARMIRVADADAALVARQLGVHLESRGYTGDSLDLAVLADIDRTGATWEHPGLAIMLATNGGLFGVRNDLVDPDGGQMVVGVWYALDESDDQLDYLIGSEFSPESIGLTMEEAIALSRSMSEDEFLLYFKL